MENRIIHLQDIAGEHLKERMESCFRMAAETHSIACIDPGVYTIVEPVGLVSGLKVEATGAVFRFPGKLGDAARVTMFRGEKIHDLHWHGGSFEGDVFDPERPENPWQPNAETVGILVSGGRDLSFRDIRGYHLAGPVVALFGEETVPVRNVHVERLQCELCGKFMWDYGYLWQRITFPDQFSPAEVANAHENMTRERMSGVLRFDGTKILGDIPAATSPDGAVTFFGKQLPAGLTRGRYYYAEDIEGGICIRETRDGAPLTFADSGEQVRLFRGIYEVYHAMYAPKNCGISKGAVDLRFCEDVLVTDCQISSSGDATHFDHCRRICVKSNQIHGGRMGAMFFAFGCEDVLCEGNIVDGGNGSRVLTVETGGTNVRIVGNVFQNGGRGTWIDTPHGLEIRGNVFLRNTGKCRQDPKLGRISPTRGTFERYAEMYFTTRKCGATYGDICIEGNVFDCADCTAAIALTAAGENIRIAGNRMTGGGLYVSPECKNVTVEENAGQLPLLREIPLEAFDIPGRI